MNKAAFLAPAVLGGSYVYIRKMNDRSLSKIVNRISLMHENLHFPVPFLISGQIYHGHLSQGNVRTALSNRWHWGCSRGSLEVTTWAEHFCLCGP